MQRLRRFLSASTTLLMGQLRSVGNLARSLAAAQQRRGFAADTSGHSWKWLKERGHDINPCRSKLHPAVVLAKMDPDEGEEISVQRAYNPESSCWGCGDSAVEDGLHLQSYRGKDGLQAELSIPKRFQAFPGIVNGGVVNVAFDCHGNWTAAIALMDRAALPKPPFTLSSSLQVQYHDVTPPDTPLQLESKVVSIVENERTGNHKVTVDLSLATVLPDDVKKVLVSGRGVFIKRGASRSL